MCAKNEKMKKVFISYNHQDKTKANWLAKYFEKNGISCWIDEIDLKIGTSLINEISIAIEKTEYLVPLLSPNSVSSNWVEKELSIAMTKEINGKKIGVIPALIEDCNIPFYLSDKIYANLTNEKTFNNELQKLFSSIDDKLTKLNLPDFSILYQNKDWQSILMIQSFADREEWGEPSYHCTNPKRRLNKILKVFGGNKHPVAQNLANQLIDNSISRILDLNPEILGIGGSGRTASRISDELMSSKFQGEIHYWGGDIGKDACTFLKENGVKEYY